MNDLTDAMTQPPRSPRGVALHQWLQTVDRTGHGWEALFAALLPQCERTVRDFSDVRTADEGRSLCMEYTYERWVGEWLDGAPRDEARPFAVFVSDKLRDVLRAERRKRARRATMQRDVAAGSSGHAVEAGDDDRGVVLQTAHTGSVEAPDVALRQRDVLARIEAHPRVGDAERAVLWMLMKGYSQREIARMSDTSEATVSRAVALLRTLFASALEE